MSYAIQKEPVKMTVRQFKKANQAELINAAQLRVTNTETNQDVTDMVVFDKELIDTHEFNQVQRLPISIRVDRTGAVDIGYIDVTLTKKHIFRYIFLALLLIIVAGGLSMCHQHLINQQNDATNSQQNAQIASNHNKLNDALAQIKALHQQVKDLKSAVQQYKQDQNKQAFNQQLQNIQNQINNIKQQQASQNQEISDLLNRLNNAINELINASPQQTDQILSKYHLN